MKKDVIPSLRKFIIDSKNLADKKHVAWLSCAIFDYVPWDIDTTFALSLLELSQDSLSFSACLEIHSGIIEKLKSKIM